MSVMINFESILPGKYFWEGKNSVYIPCDWCVFKTPNFLIMIRRVLKKQQVYKMNS